MYAQPLTLLANELVFVNLDISCWSGKKSLTPEDLGLDRSQLPPETLVSLGEKQLIHPAALREFTTIRSAAHRHCLAVGTRFMGGYAIPVAKAQGLLDQLTGLEQRYQAARTTFLDTYDTQLATWANQQPPEWQKLIREALVPAEYVGGRLHFAVQAVRFDAPSPQVITHPGLENALSGLSGQILSEIGQQARETLEASFQGKTTVTRRALSPLKALRDKLEGLSFVDSGFRAVVLEIDRLLASVPAHPPISGRVLEGLRQFLCLASQPQGLQTWAAQALPVVDELWADIQPEVARATSSSEDAEPSPFNEDAEPQTFNEDAEPQTFNEDAESQMFNEDAEPSPFNEAVASRSKPPAEAEVIDAGGEWFY
ncbi:MAG: DUF3150 domain-containing protein [Candidatus Competibacteraceae bacterium]|nr:DUF3150 domain-containing protein [Candidatus Competibacteraceae bacterium]MBK8750985.1 DUF3150 domain-containing protein [Candidatus Competibacteraceae bacterium]